MVVKRRELNYSKIPIVKTRYVVFDGLNIGFDVDGVKAIAETVNVLRSQV